MRVKPGAGHSPLHCLPDIWCTYDDVLHLSKWGPNFEWNGTWWAFNMYAASFDEQTLKYFDEDWGPKSPLAKAPVQYSLNKMDSFLIGIMGSSSKFFLFGQILPPGKDSSSLVQFFLMGKTLPHGYNSSSLARLSPVDFFLVVMHVQSVLLCLRILHRTLHISDVLSPLIESQPLFWERQPLFLEHLNYPLHRIASWCQLTGTFWNIVIILSIYNCGKDYSLCLRLIPEPFEDKSISFWVWYPTLPTIFSWVATNSWQETIMIVAHSLETSIFGMGPQLNEARY